jgi:4-diphosphocytidyl-2-C-methyl-D-erythritol kinase
MLALYDVPAPAKLNLFLHVTGRRPDGYHLLQSAFMLIDWCDTLDFERTGDGLVSREDLAEPLPAEDLCVRAARALQQASGCPYGVRIRLLKRIPAQAGLGGGSSDAASTLLALNRLWELRLTLPELERIGLELGADVPFFLRGRTAWVEGIGEQLSPIDVPPARFLVAKPPAGLATRDVFSHPGLPRSGEAAIISGFAANPFQFGRNDLQAVAEDLCGDVTLALKWLGSQGLQGRMSGSGSAVFALLPTGQEPKAPPAGWQVRECGNMEVHPLSGWAASDDSSVGG